jgi:ribosomal protein L37AE/L43A
MNHFSGFDPDHPDARIERLEQNYRSTKRILEIASKLYVREAGGLVWLHEAVEAFGALLLSEGYLAADEKRAFVHSAREMEADMRLEHASEDCTGQWRTRAVEGVVACNACDRCFPATSAALTASARENMIAHRWKEAEKEAWRRGWMAPGHRFGPSPKVQR